MSAKKLIFLGFVLVLLIAIPLAVFLVQQQQETRSKAAPATKLSFSPASASVKTGENLKFDIFMDPGTNQVSFTKLVINYDPTKLAKTGEGLKENSLVFQSPPLEGPAYDETTATATISLSVGADPSKVITKLTKIASISFKALAPTDPSTPSQISFGADTQALSIGSSDAANENVIQQSSLSTASITIASGSGPAPTTVPSGSSQSSTTNKSPDCTNLAVDRSPTGTAPFSIAFAANGTDPDGTIQKASFVFGDGQVQDVTQGGNLGTNSVNVQIAHTYNNAGNYKATVALTDDKNGVSDSAKCTQSIVVSTGLGGINPTGEPSNGSTESAEVIDNQVITQLITPIPEVTIPPVISIVPTIASPGPTDTILKLGGAAAILSIIGGILFFLL